MSGDTKSESKGGSKADTLVKVVLVFFIALLSFSVGTFVGKNVTDADHRRLALEGEVKGADRSVASVDEKGEGAEPAADKITEKEVENLTEEFVNKEKAREPAEAKEGEEHEGHASEGHASEVHAAGELKQKEEGYKTYEHGSHGKVAGSSKESEAKGEASEHGEHGAEHAEKKAPAHGAEAAHKAMAHGEKDATHKVAEKVAEGHAPTDGKKEERKPQSILPSVAGSSIGKYTVQVASYADEKEAKTHAAGLHEKGLNAFYVSANVNGKTWFRVLVGLFDSMKSADEYKTQLVKDIGTKSAIVQKIVQ